MNHRLSKLRESLQSGHRDAVLLSDSFSVQFFSGFSSSNALYLITGTKEIFITDPRYLSGAKEFFCSSEVEVRNFPKKEEWKNFFQELGVTKLGIEMSKVLVTTFRQWEESFFLQLEDFSPVAEKIRAEKSTSEIVAAQKAASIADEALKKVLPLLQPGISEKAFSWELEKAGRELGAEKVSFEAIVAFGEHSAVPHHSPTERVLQKNDAILIDWGFIADGFCSDCTRCFFMGEPSDEWIKTYKKVLAAQQAGITAMLPGKEIANVQQVTEDVLGEKMLHSFGHGVGVEVHEFPGISTKSNDMFIKNMLVTAEPGLYRAREFGIRIEDIGVIEKNGFRSLTKFPKNIESTLLQKNEK